MPITPDTKNWTWVLETPCPECGYDASTIEAQDVAGLLSENVAAWPAVLEQADVRERPSDDVWSDLEYASHVRDVYRIYLERLTLMLETEDPLYPNWDQDATAVAEAYNEQDPAVVSMELATAGEALADRFETVHGAQWQRPGRRDDGEAFTIETFAKYFIHDPIHHLWDVTKPKR